MACSERDENERDIPLMDLLDRWESHHKIQDKIHLQTFAVLRILDVCPGSRIRIF
jgi:hypothetical protein